MISLEGFLLKLYVLFVGFWNCFIYKIYRAFVVVVFLWVSDAFIQDTKQINSFQKNYALLCIFSCFPLQPHWKADILMNQLHSAFWLQACGSFFLHVIFLTCFRNQSKVLKTHDFTVFIIIYQNDLLFRDHFKQVHMIYDI